MSKKRRKPAVPIESESSVVPFSAGHALFLALAVSLQLFLGLMFIRSAAPTYDESVHLASGYSYLKTNRFRMNILDHPPLAEMWAALPVTFMNADTLFSHPDWSAMRLYHYADAFVFKNRVSGQKMMNAARAFLLITLSALLLWAIGRWAYRLGGASASVCAVLAAALSPVLISNISLAGTDGVSATFFFLVFLFLSDGTHSFARRWCVAGVCAGLALASKFNMIVLFPIAGGMLILNYLLRVKEARAAKKPAPTFPWTGVVCAALCAAAAVVIVYRVTDVSLYWTGLTATLKRLGQGRSTFFHGEHSVTGFWLYFPAAILLKTPIALLLLAKYEGWRRVKECLRGNVARPILWAMLPPVAYFIVAMISKVQVGVRHLLPIVPFLALWAGLGAARLWDRGGKARWVAAAGGLWMLLSVGQVHPYQLAYFNELAGGPAGGYRWLVDSNLDWGQDLESLGKDLRQRGNPPIYLSYFGSADPSAYGIRYVPAGMCCNVTRTGDAIDPVGEGRVLFAVSATNRQAVYFRDKTIFKWLDSRRPIKTLGHSIFLYDLTDDREGRERLARLVGAVTGDPSRVKSLLLQ